MVAEGMVGQAQGQAGHDQSGLRTPLGLRIVRAVIGDGTRTRSRQTVCSDRVRFVDLDRGGGRSHRCRALVGAEPEPSRAPPMTRWCSWSSRSPSHRGVIGWPPLVAALVAAASFDFLLTRPYGSFRISRQADITTEILFVVVGLLVGELAARGRQHQRAAARGRHELFRTPRSGGAHRQRGGPGLRPDRRRRRTAGAAQPAGLPLRPRPAVGEGGLDRQRRHGAIESPALALRHRWACRPSRSNSRFGAGDGCWAPSS